MPLFHKLLLVVILSVVAVAGYDLYQSEAGLDTDGPRLRFDPQTRQFTFRRPEVSVRIIYASLMSPGEPAMRVEDKWINMFEEEYSDRLAASGAAVPEAQRAAFVRKMLADLAGDVPEARRRVQGIGAAAEAERARLLDALEDWLADRKVYMTPRHPTTPLKARVAAFEDLVAGLEALEADPAEAARKVRVLPRRVSVERRWQGRWVLSANRPRFLTGREVPDIMVSDKMELLALVQDGYAVAMDEPLPGGAVSPLDGPDTWGKPGRSWRQAFIPTGNATATFARMINNEVDVDVTPQPGEFVAGKAKNPELGSWNAQGPAWGAPDACMFTLGLNTRWGPCADVHVRRAVQAAINRQKVVDLAYEGSTVPLVLPFSTYGGLEPYRKLCDDLVEKYKPGNPDPGLVLSEMEAAGYQKDKDGFWAKDGKRMVPEFYCACWLGPLAPVLEKQLRDAGFDVTVKLTTTTCDPFFEAVQQGRADIWIIVHCGSSREPWGTLQHYHSKWSSPEQGKPTNYIWANSQYNNPEYDALIDQLDRISPSPTDKKYTDLVHQCIEVYLRDVIEITLSEERWVRTYNYHFWKGWPNASEPYVAPYALWASIMLAILKVEPTGATS